MANRLEGKRIIITGAVNNIGKCAVKQFVAEGARVVIGDRDEAGALTAAEFGTNVTFIKVDVTSEYSVQNLIERGTEWLGGLDVLAQNAGMQFSGAITDFDADKWDKLFAVNSRAHFFGAKYAIPHLLKNGGGSIINTSSLAGKRGGPGMVAYSASKGAVIAFTTALAMELAPNNIRVNAICPGWVDTAFNNPAIEFMGGTSAQHDAVVSMVPMKRQARSNEIAPMFVYLASDESSYMTAQAITIDGGVYNS
jgi:NAD(P)-dependent dehydrogenase (short-subunit alcohol dehydrogenase family)